MSDHEAEILNLESQFPALSGQAFAAAREQALHAGLSVLQSEDGRIYQVSPTGEKKLIKEITPPVQVIAGTKYVIP